MRDIILLIAFPILLFYCLRQPAVTLFLAVWTSLVPTANWTFGFADSIRINLIITVLLILQFSTNKMKKSVPDKNGVFIFILFVLHFITSSMLNNKNEFQFQAMSDYLKSCVLGIIIMYTCGNAINYKSIMLGIVLSVSFYASKEAALYITSSGTNIIDGIIGSLSDNNKFALGAACTIPVLLYFFKLYENQRIHKYFTLALILGVIASVIASSSRGAFLAIGSYVIVLIYNSKQKIKMVATVACVVPMALLVASDNWFDRMNTIKTAEQDSSFIGRVNSWKISYLIASEHPFIGGGIDAVNYNWYEYKDLVNTVPVFDITPIPERGLVAHSIYFEVLGNQGVIGFILATLLILKCFKNIINNQESEYIVIKHSIIIFLIGGAALSFFYSQLTVIMIALALSLKKNQSLRFYRAH